MTTRRTIFKLRHAEVMGFFLIITNCYQHLRNIKMAEIMSTSWFWRSWKWGGITKNKIVVRYKGIEYN